MDVKYKINQNINQFGQLAMTNPKTIVVFETEIYWNILECKFWLKLWSIFINIFWSTLPISQALLQNLLLLKNPVLHRRAIYFIIINNLHPALACALAWVK